MKNSFVVGVVSVVLLAVSGFLLVHKSAPVKVAVTPTVVTADAPEKGATVGPDQQGPYQCINGVCTFYNRVAFKTATTTICAIKSPNATSSLSVTSGIAMRTSSTTASLLTYAKATTAFATTTLLGSQFAVPANAQANFLASTTAAQVVSGTNVFAPNTYFVVGMQGGTGTMSPAGFCHADFTVI